MFGIDENRMNRILSCSSCKVAFDLPKVLPCGASICGKCEPSLKKGASSQVISDFVCPVCGSQHNRPTDGLPINFSLKQLIDCKPEKFSRGDIHKACQDKLNTLQNSTKRFNQKFVSAEMQVKNYCDSLRNDVDVRTESKIALLNQFKDQLLTEIEQYEENCLARIRDRANEASKMFKKLIDDSTETLRKWSVYLDLAKISDNELKKGIEEAESAVKSFGENESPLSEFIFEKGKFLLIVDEKQIITKEHIFQSIRHGAIKHEWKVSAKHSFFNLTSNQDIWSESYDGKIIFKFEIIKKENKEVIIYDWSRKMYLKISNDKMFSGTAVDKIKTFAYTGEWKSGPF
jgi:hypothetical protein